jgi:hypothetical protein
LVNHNILIWCDAGQAAQQRSLFGPLTVGAHKVILSQQTLIDQHASMHITSEGAEK